MIRALFVVTVIGLLASWPADARAQYGYPAGYGGYGWGGWGSTPQSALARGLGYFNLGRGAYNEQTAVARSINADTVMRWNQFAYQSHVTATNSYHARLLARRNSINRARAETQEQLRNNPSTYDIYDGNALNLLLDILTNPGNGGTSLGRITTPLKHELIPEIPFTLASEGLTMCLDQMTMTEQWPLALRVDDFKPEREGLRKVVLVALEQDKDGDLEPATVEAVHAAVDRFRLKFEKVVPQTSPDFIPASDTIKAMAGLTKMLYSPKVEEILAELEDYQGTTLGELLSFMQAFSLRFGPANSFRQRRIYLKLYPMLAEQANGPGGSSSVGQAAQAAQATARQAVGSAEELGSKAIDGLKSAAVDFFKDMEWKHLSGKGKPAAP
jgi:hypothetical protein